MKNNSLSLPKMEFETPHQDFPVEWWFFQGIIHGKNERQFEFMISFFRINVALENEPNENGFSVLLTFLDLQTGQNFTLSQIDNAIMNGIFKRIDLLDDSELDRDLARVLYNELRRHGPPQPIKLSKEDAELNSESLKIKWNDIKIEQRNDEFFIEFYSPLVQSTISIALEPAYPRILLDTEEKNNVLQGNMSYATCPRMKLSGTINEESISGSAWFDHQWGDQCWFVTDSRNKKVLGWDWFGINLSNEVDIIILVHKHMRTSEILYSSATVLNSNGAVKVYKNVIIKPVREWESPKTHIKYPIECEIEIPELELNVKFIPNIDDQEIIVVGNGRAIWEGAGSVKGTIGIEKVWGRTRAEFFGYGYIFDFQNYLKVLTDRVNKRIEEFLPKNFNGPDVEKFVGKPFWKHEPDAYTKLLATPSWDLLLRKGKRWRPVFGILMIEALGMLSERYEALACLAELVHSGALIIDDIEDNSLLRRGEECLHLRYGVDVAINAGNTLYFLPTVELMNHKYLDDIQKLRIHEIMMNTYMQAHFGQTVDLYWTKYLSHENLNNWMNDSLEEKILQLYDYKTAAGAKGLAEISAVIARVDDTTKKVCVDYARAFAVAFQIIDDIHNFSSSPRWTKTCGEDLTSGKVTYLIVRSLRMLDKKKSERLKTILCSEELRKNRDVILEGIELVRNSGAIEECKEKAKKMSHEENDRFSIHIPSCEPKIMLNMLCMKMLDLAFDV